MASVAMDGWLRQVLGVDVRPAGPPTGPDRIRERFVDLRQLASLLPEPGRTALREQVDGLAGRAANADPAALDGEVARLEADLSRAAATARAAEAAAHAGTVVSFRRLQAEWANAQGRARQQLDQFVRQVLADPDVQDHPEWERIKQGLAEAASALPDFGDALHAQLEAIDDAADDAGRGAARRAAAQTVEAYGVTLASADVLHELQSLADDEYGGLAFYAELQRSLRSLGSQLRKAA